MPESVFECGAVKCAYAIATASLNGVQLKALRMWNKTCPRCGERTMWQEKIPLLNTKTISNDLGGSNESLNTTHINLPKTASQKRKQARHDGSH